MSTWRSHANLEASYPEDRDQAEQVEVARRKDHIKIHGDDKAYVPARTFPCKGQLVFEDRSGPIWIVVCDACGFSMGLPSKMFSAIPDAVPF